VQNSVRFAEPVASSRSLSASSIPSDFTDVLQHPALRISRRTASAILSALESLRSPFPFTPDLAEENAQMSELAGGSASGRASNGGARAQGPIPVSQAQQEQPRALLPPTEIMRRRLAREKATQEADAAAAATSALAQSRPTGGSSSIPMVQRPSGRPISMAGPSSTQGSHRPTNSAPESQLRIGESSSQYPSTPHTSTIPGAAGVNPSPGNRPAAQASDPSSVPRPRPNTLSQGQPRPVPPAASAGASQRYPPQQPSQSAAGPSQPRPAPSSATTSGSQAPAPNFPHAFERWETLSSHWEGLTSYWIRRLEQNTEELKREPLLQQLSRQVTDLSAAGANLFHAVVELQRLRASSERKFQRWFHETRKEAERQQEVAAQFERALVGERGARANDLNILQAELDAALARAARLEKHNSEMQREQQISKEEARRAWEELGRREQEARDQVTALREGNPILIGGIQVFPTGHGTTTHLAEEDPRQIDRDEFEGQYEQRMGGDVEAATQPQGSPTNTDPFNDTFHPLVHPTHPAHTSPTAGIYQHPGESLHNTIGHETLSTDNEDDEYERDEYNQIRRDAQGRPIVHRPGLFLSPGQDDEESADDVEHERARRGRHGAPSSTAVSYPAIPAPTSAPIAPISAPMPPATYGGPIVSHPPTSHGRYDNLAPADYEGAGYVDEYDDVHQINSRLSVVEEADEEASKASEASQGGRSGHNARPAPF